jgi:hypothetical protein
VLASVFLLKFAALRKNFLDFLECGGLDAAFTVQAMHPAYRLGTVTHRAKQIALS